MLSKATVFPAILEKNDAMQLSGSSLKMPRVFFPFNVVPIQTSLVY